MSEMRRAARALVERRVERIESHHPLEESKARLAAALARAELPGNHTVFTTSWTVQGANAVLEASYAPTQRTSRRLQAMSLGMAMAVGASIWAIVTQEGALRFLLPLSTAFAVLAVPYVALGLGSQRAAEEARIARAIRIALLDEEERFPKAQRWEDED